MYFDLKSRMVGAWSPCPRSPRPQYPHPLQPFGLLLSLIWTMGILGCTLHDPKIEYPIPIDRPPTFDAYPAHHIYKSAPKPVNLLSHPRALHFQDHLIALAKSGPNFAGHYTIARWNCGNECQQLAIIDARTGTVIFAPFVTHLGFRFRHDSRLLIVNPLEAVERAARQGKPRSHYRTVYYVWHFDRLTEVYAILHK